MNTAAAACASLASMKRSGFIITLTVAHKATNMAGIKEGHPLAMTNYSMDFFYCAAQFLLTSGKIAFVCFLFCFSVRLHLHGLFIDEEQKEVKTVVP